MPQGRLGHMPYGGGIMKITVLRKLNLFTDCQNRRGKYGKRENSQENHCRALSQKFVIVPGPSSVCSGSLLCLFSGKPVWVLTCPKAYALSRQAGEREREGNHLVGRETPLAWTVFLCWHYHKLHSQMEENVKEDSCKWRERIIKLILFCTGYQHS